MDRQICGRCHERAVGHGIDAVRDRSGALYLAKAQDGSSDGLEDAFYRALAERIFVEDAPLWCAAALEKALRIDIFEARRVASERTGGNDEDVGDDEEKTVDGPGQAQARHRDWKPDPKKNLPNPGPLPDGAGVTRPSSPPTRGQTKSARTKVVSEDVQIAALKADHYAWHCQIGLARSTPAELAPKGSYAEPQENRHKVIEAHHVDFVEAGGARHAGNILILSHLEHHRWAGRLSREQIVEALKSAEPKALRFKEGGEARVVDGFVARVEIAATGEVLPIFFTAWHRRYWLGERTEH